MPPLLPKTSALARNGSARLFRESDMRDPMLAVERNIQDQISDDPWRAENGCDFDRHTRMMMSRGIVDALARREQPKREWR